MLKAAASVGNTVGNTVKHVSKLGPPPKNRLNAIMVIDGVKHKLGFDVVAEQQRKWRRGRDGFVESLCSSP